MGDTVPNDVHTNHRGELVAAPGDWIIISGHRVGEPERRGLITATRDEGLPPFTVRWTDADDEHLFFPGSDAHVVAHPDHGPA